MLSARGGACAGAPAIDLLGSGATLQQHRHGSEHLGRDVLEQAAQVVEIGRLLQRPLIQVERAVDLELQRLHAVGRIAVVLGDEPARVGPVDLHLVAVPLQQIAHEARELGVARGSEAIPQNEVRPHAGLSYGGRRHRVAVDQDGHAEPAARLFDQVRQGRVEGAVQPLDALEGHADRHALPVDLLAVGDDAGDGAEAAHDAGGLGVGEVGQAPAEQFRIELIGLPVHVEVGAGKTRRDQGRAERHDRLEQLVDVAILRLAQGVRVEPGCCQERLGVDAARMGRAEDHRRELLLRLVQQERRRQLCKDRGTFAGVH